MFPAIPAPVAVVCGFDLLPKAHPALVVYDNDKQHGGFIQRLKVNEHDRK
jgi:SMODS-associated and fused to various effectors sensor domain